MSGNHFRLAQQQWQQYVQQSYTTLYYYSCILKKYFSPVWYDIVFLQNMKPSFFKQILKP